MIHAFENFCDWFFQGGVMWVAVVVVGIGFLVMLGEAQLDQDLKTGHPRVATMMVEDVAR